MKKTTLLAFALVLGWFSAAHAQVWVDPYTRLGGTPVQEHHQSSPDSNPYNNYSHPGDVNPYIGEKATSDPNRYLERYNQGNSGLAANKSGPVYNPFTIYRR